MLKTPQSLGANVCLRCELRFLRRALRGSTPFKHRSAHISTTAQRYEEPQPTQKQRFRYDRTYSEDGGEIYKHIYPHGRIRGRKGKEVREETAQLEVKSLGEPSEIIVLKEAGFDRQDQVDKTDIEKQDKGKENAERSISSQDILRSIEDQKRTPTQTAINADIEALRRSVMTFPDERTDQQSAARFSKVRDKLAESYSQKQLLGYLDHIKPWKTTSFEHSKALMDASPVEARSEWIPSRHSTATRLPLRQEIFPKSLSSRRTIKKIDLARLIVGHCWNIRVEGQEGDLELRLPSNLMDVLKAGRM